MSGFSHLSLIIQHHQIAGAAGDKQVKAVLGVVARPDGGVGAPDQRLDGFDHMAGQADVGDGYRALIAALIVHHNKGIHVAPLHLADALVNASAGCHGKHAGAHKVGGR